MSELWYVAIIGRSNTGHHSQAIHIHQCQRAVSATALHKERDITYITFLLPTSLRLLLILSAILTVLFVLFVLMVLVFLVVLAILAVLCVIALL